MFKQPSCPESDVPTPRGSSLSCILPSTCTCADPKLKWPDCRHCDHARCPRMKDNAPSNSRRGWMSPERDRECGTVGAWDRIAATQLVASDETPPAFRVHR